MTTTRTLAASTSLGPAVQALGKGSRFPREFRVCFYGDSKSVLMGGSAGNSKSSWRWATALYPFNWLQLGSAGVSGAVLSAADLGSDARIANMTAAFDAGANVLVWKGGTNGDPSNPADPVASAMQAFRKIHLAAIAHGCELLIIMGLNPDESGSSYFESLDQAYRQYALYNPNVWYCDSTPALLDPTISGRKPRGRATGAAGAVTSDGIHESYLGAYLEGKALAALLREQSVPATFDLSSASLGLDQAGNAQRVGNIYGDAGLFQGSGNTGGITLSGGGGVTGGSAWPPGVTLGGTLSGTLAVAISDVACDLRAAKTYGQSALSCKRLTFTGTPTADVHVVVGLDKNIYPDQLPLGTVFRQQFIVQPRALTGFFGFIEGNNQNASACDQLPQLDDPLYWTAATTDVGQQSAQYGTYEDSIAWGLAFRSGVAASGAVDLVAAVGRPIYPTQAPSA